MIWILIISPNHHLFNHWLIEILISYIYNLNLNFCKKFDFKIVNKCRHDENKIKNLIIKYIIKMENSIW